MCLKWVLSVSEENITKYEKCSQEKDMQGMNVVNTMFFNIKAD